MADDVETQKRKAAEALLSDWLKETVARKPPIVRTGAEKLKLKRQLAKTRRTKTRRSKEKRKALKKKHPNRRTQSQGVPLAERLLARTEPGTWYYFRQLRALLPETTMDGFKAIMFQKLPRLGWIERKQLVANPQASWLNHTGPADEKEPGEMYAATLAAIAPKYLYRIGAKQAVERAQAREKLSALELTRADAERALAGEFDGFEDL